MSKKIVYIILGALLIFGILFLVWSWFFGGTTASPLHSGQFGSAGDISQSGGTGTPGGNYTTTLGQAGSGKNSANGSIPLNGTRGTNGTGSNTVGTNSTGATGATGAGGARIGAGATKGSGATLNTSGTLGINSGSTANPNGVIWLGGGNNFTPAEINSLSNGAGGFTPRITTAPSGSNGGTSLIAALAATAIAGGLTCALPSLVASISAAGTAGSTGAAASSLTLSATGVPVTDLGSHAALTYIAGQETTQTARNAASDSNQVVNCLVNVIAKVALQQITISVVNWINSGFNGQPSFVNNFQQFFTNVADLAAGQFIQGSGLAFLCSPFKLQIKVAIAQSYANRGAQSCSLTGIIKNVNNFMNGSFTQGGWPGLLQFTTVPTNNPYGAFAYAQIGLATAQNNATVNAKNNISPTGFLNLQQVYGCNNPSQNGVGAGASVGTNAQAASAAGTPALGPGCKTKVVTPGGLIADSLGAVNKSGIDQLGLTNSIDQIISALTTQLITKTLQNGLSSLSQGTTQTTADLAAQQQAANLLIDMQNRISIAQQIGTIDQGSIRDIEGAQNNLNTLANCWSAVASSTASGAPAAAQKAAAANATFDSLNAQINGYNNDITRLNGQIATINQFETQVSSAATAAEVASASASYKAVLAGGTFAAQADVTTAQQNRTTLQSQMAALNLSTATGLQQCQAAH